MGNHCNNYGFSGAGAAICAAIAWFLVQNKSCAFNVVNNLDTDHLQMFHYIAIIVGVVLFVLSFFDFAGILYEITILFIAAAIAIFASGGMMLYATYSSFHISCKGLFGNAINGLLSKNVFDAQDEVGMTIMVLDLLCALMLISAAISFSRTY